VTRTSDSTELHNAPFLSRYSQRPGGFVDYLMDNVTDTNATLRGLLERLG